MEYRQHLADLRNKKILLELNTHNGHFKHAKEQRQKATAEVSSAGHVAQSILSSTRLAAEGEEEARRRALSCALRQIRQIAKMNNSATSAYFPLKHVLARRRRPPLQHSRSVPAYRRQHVSCLDSISASSAGLSPLCRHRERASQSRRPSWRRNRSFRAVV